MGSRCSSVWTGPRTITTCTSKTTPVDRLGGGRLPEGVEGVARFHEWVARHVDDPADVVIATETDRACSSGRWSPPATWCWR